MKNGTRAITALIVMVAVLAPANLGYTAPKPTPAMATGGFTSQPIGHYEFCQSYSSECATRSKAQPAPRVTDYGWNLIRDINATVNAEIVPLTDVEIFGREEVWEYPTHVGDCEDFVLLKRKQLIEKGFSPADLLITVVRKPDGEGHAVLTVRTVAGDFILDNLSNEILLWNETPYRFLKRQASIDTGRWVTIENGNTEVLVGALN